MRRTLAPRATTHFIEDQWRQYTRLCGNWRGTWHRFSNDGEGKLAPGRQPFQAMCGMSVAADGRSVRHINRYEPGAEPPGMPQGSIGPDGLRAVDFGTFDLVRFRSPFGPASAAVYGEDCAALASTTLGPSNMIAVELIASSEGSGGEGPSDGTAPVRQRRRLIAMWRAASDGLVGQLASVTAVIESEGQDIPEGTQNFANDRPHAWSRSCLVTTSEGSPEVPGISQLLPGASPWTTADHVMPGHIWAWTPSPLPLRLDGGTVEVAMGWRTQLGRFIRVGAVYRDGKFDSLVRDDFCHAT